LSRFGGLSRSRNNDGRPDFTWHSTDDMHRVFGLNRAQSVPTEPTMSALAAGLSGLRIATVAAPGQ
jgi:hypothetical protein